MKLRMRPDWNCSLLAVLSITSLLVSGCGTTKQSATDAERFCRKILKADSEAMAVCINSRTQGIDWQTPEQICARNLDSEEEIANCAAAIRAANKAEGASNEAEFALYEVEVLERKSYGRGEWKTKIETDPITDNQNVSLTLTASSGLNKWMEKPTLVVRCNNHRMQLYFNLGTFIDIKNPEVVDRIDDAPPQTNLWNISTDRKQISRPDSLSVVRILVLADKYIIRTTPYSEDTVTATFDVRGLALAADPLRAACGW